MDVQSSKLVVGIYGISGSGKSYALSNLRNERPEWRCLEGSEIVDQILRGRGLAGLPAMKTLSSGEAMIARLEAISRIQSFVGVTVVAGHCSFPVKESGTMSFQDVFTSGDAETYDAILYLNKDAVVVSKQVADDSSRDRAMFSVDELDQGIRHEQNLLRIQCSEKGKVRTRAEMSSLPHADIFLLIDGDRTLSPQDTGRLYFECLGSSVLGTDPLKAIFQRYSGYSFQAFNVVALLYTSSASTGQYRTIARDVGKQQVKIHDEWLSFLTRLPEQVHPVLVSCSSREIWTSALKERGWLGSRGVNISVIAGNQVELHQYIVDGPAKQIVSQELRRNNPGCKIISFGDSELDEHMLRVSDRAYVVLEEKRRNRLLQSFLQSSALDTSNRVYQLALNKNMTNYFHDGIRVGSLDGLLQELTDGSLHALVNISATSPAAMALAGQARRADLTPLALQEVHVEVGRVLADHLLDAHSYEDVSLLEEATFQHVQGSQFSGLVTRSSNVLIFALMRGGEPMARGVFARFPSAAFVHYSDTDDSTAAENLKFLAVMKGIVHVLVVDSVVNHGTSIRCVLQRLFGHKNCLLRIYVLVGVMHSNAGNTLPREFPRVRFLCRRVSHDQYTGLGGTDTGNRHFGTLVPNHHISD